MWSIKALRETQDLSYFITSEITTTYCRRRSYWTHPTWRIKIYFSPSTSPIVDEFCFIFLILCLHPYLLLIISTFSRRILLLFMRQDNLLTLGLLVTLLTFSAYAQGCLNHVGTPVDWWVILKVPPKIGTSGFGYYDSTFKSATFQYIPNYVDQGSSALTLTMYQINELNL